MRRNLYVFVLLAAMVALVLPVSAQTIGINVVLNTSISQAILADLDNHGKVKDVVAEIDAVTMLAKASELPVIQALPYVAAANPDQQRGTGPEDSLAVSDYLTGRSTWDLDAINVTDFGVGRTLSYTGADVYVAILDTGLVSNWPYYFGTQRIATQYARSFGGGGMDVGNVSEQPNKWGLDQNSHGTHVTSTILGYKMGGIFYNGVAPAATVIPVKVLNQNGSGWSSVIARGIVYVTDLKINDLGGAPVVINMSLGGPNLDAMEQAAIDYAVSNNVIVVASAGNNGNRGMGYPGAYAPVVSAAAVGWNSLITPSSNWYNLDVPDPTNISDFFIPSWSSKALAGQSLDVAAPGNLVVGSYQVNGQISYYYLSGTSMASPHVAGVVALMLEKNSGLSGVDVHAILMHTALPFPGCTSYGLYCWTNKAGAGLIQADAALAMVP